MEIVYIIIILVLLFIILELFRWNQVYIKTNKMLTTQNDSFVKTHTELCEKFVEQFKKYNNESIHTRKMLDSYTNLYKDFQERLNNKTKD